MEIDPVAFFRSSFNPALREVDMILLALQVFLPLAFAGFILPIPARWPQLMRWLALIGVTATLILGMCRFIDYYTMLDSYSDRSLANFYHPESRLDTRSERQLEDAYHLPLPKPYRSDDWLTRRPWVSALQIDFALGLDGINMALVLLTALIQFFAILASWRVTESLRGYLVLMLLLQTGVTGAFLALDLFLFFVFYEVLLLPMFFLIGLWGGKRRSRAAMKFVIYTLAGSVMILGAFLALYSIDVRDFVPQGKLAAEAADRRQNDPRLSPEAAREQTHLHTFDWITLAKVGRAVALIQQGEEHRIAVQGSRVMGSVPTGTATAPAATTTNQPNAEPVPLLAPGVDREAALARLKAQPVAHAWFQYLIFGLLFLGFAIKLPLVPFHNWLPDAHVEAPTPVSMVLAGVLLKLGGYGLLRFAYPLAPWAAWQLNDLVAIFGGLSILYGALAALAQSDFKKLLAYSSISHMGYVVLGLAAWAPRADAHQWAVNGAMYQMISHGLTSAGLFFVVGMIYDRVQHRDLDLLGGLKEPMPRLTGVTVILLFGSMALPGLSGFLGEFFALLGLWNYNPWLTLPGILTTILTAGYLLWAFQRAFLGVNSATTSLPDASARELAVLLPLAGLTIFLGVFPSMVISWLDPSVYAWVSQLHLH